MSHCLLNQNARSVGTSRYPGPIKELLNIFSEAGVGIVQIPCPHVEFEKGIHRKSKITYTSKYKNECKKLSTSILKQIEAYISKNYKVLGVLGVELSSTCGVRQIKSGSRSVPGKGILIEALEEQMRKKNFQVPIVGVDLNNVYSSVEKINQMLKYY